MDQLKKLAEISKFAVPVLILCSCIQLMTYYYYWNIPIVDYLSIAELLFLFIKPLLTIIALATIYFTFNLTLGAVVALYVFWKSPKKKEKETPEVEATEPLASSEKEKDAYGVFARVAVAFTSLVFISVFVEGIWFDYDVVPVVVVHVVLWMAAIVLTSRLLFKSTNGKISLESFFAGTIIMLISASFFFGRYQAHYAALSPVPYRIVLADGSKIETDSNLIYLGKTSSYYFFYDKKKVQASIIPVGEAKRTDIMGRAPILATDGRTTPQVPMNPRSGEK